MQPQQLRQQDSGRCTGALTSQPASVHLRDNRSIERGQPSLRGFHISQHVQQRTVAGRAQTQPIQHIDRSVKLSAGTRR
jgi:hypothetical protein